MKDVDIACSVDKIREYFLFEAQKILWYIYIMTFIILFLVSFSTKVPKRTNFGKWTPGGRKSLGIMH